MIDISMTEYSGFKYATFFLAEYLGMFAVSGLAVTLFLGGWHAPVQMLEFVPSYIWFFAKLSMRAFVKLRQMLETNRELARKFSELERRVGKHDQEIAAILEAIRRLTTVPEKPRREIGFHVRERAGRYRVPKRA